VDEKTYKEHRVQQAKDCVQDVLYIVRNKHSTWTEVKREVDNYIKELMSVSL
jgi:hypothetical protein